MIYWLKNQIRVYFIYRSLHRAGEAWDKAQTPAEWNACRNRYGRLMTMLDKALELTPKNMQ